MTAPIVEAGAKRPGETDQHYLGDGVYAAFDGSQIWLRVNRLADDGGLATHEIALDAVTMGALVRYAGSITGKG